MTPSPAVSTQYERHVLVFSGPQQFTESPTPEPVFDASLGDTVRIGLELYGFPEPTLITLEKMNDATNLASSARHSAVYTPGLAPFGSLYVTISDLVEADFTNYTLTVDNGEESALSYEFYLKRGCCFILPHSHLYRIIVVFLSIHYSVGFISK